MTHAIATLEFRGLKFLAYRLERPGLTAYVDFEKHKRILFQMVEKSFIGLGKAALIPLTLNHLK